jgi:hypothetical protein
MLQGWKMEGSPQKSFLMGNFVIKDSGKNKYKMGGRRTDGHITDPRNKKNGGDQQKAEKNGGVF